VRRKRKRGCREDRGPSVLVFKKQRRRKQHSEAPHSLKRCMWLLHIAENWVTHFELLIRFSHNNQMIFKEQGEALLKLCVGLKPWSANKITSVFHFYVSS